MANAWTFGFEDLLEKLVMLRQVPPAKPFFIPPMPLGTFTYGQERIELGAKTVHAMIRSMTADERMLRVSLDESRMKRIARGSGTDHAHVRALERDLMAMRDVISECSAKSRRAKAR